MFHPTLSLVAPTPRLPVDPGRPTWSVVAVIRFSGVVWSGLVSVGREDPGSGSRLPLLDSTTMVSLQQWINVTVSMYLCHER